MNTPTVIYRVRLLSELCATCGATPGERCTEKANGGKRITISWTHARGKAAQ